MTDTNTVTVPERVATGRVLVNENVPDYQIFQEERYIDMLSRTVGRAGEEAFRAAVQELEAHRRTWAKTMSTDPYAEEVLANAQAPAEHLEAARAALATPERAERVALVQVLTDVLHAAAADGHAPSEVYEYRSVQRLRISRYLEADDFHLRCEIGDQLATRWSVCAEGSPFSVTVEQRPETGQAVIRDAYAGDLWSAELLAGDLVKDLKAHGHRIEHVKVDWDLVEITITVH